MKKRVLNRAYQLILLIVFCLLLTTSCQSKQSEEFSFVFLGDVQENEETQDGYAVFSSLLKSAFSEAKNPEFIMLAGDIVNDGNDIEEWQSFIKAKEEAIGDTDFYTCVGNHDDTKLQEKYFDISKYDYIKGDNSFYSFDYKNVHFTVMDSNLMGSPTTESIEWLENDLNNTTKKYKIVLFHHPAYPAVENPKDELRANAIRDIYVPIMEKYYVNLVLGGHQHTYMRTYPLKNGHVSEDGVVYLMGVASSKNYVNKDFDYIEFSKGGTPVYTILTFKEDEILIKTKDVDGNTIDSFNIR